MRGLRSALIIIVVAVLLSPGVSTAAGHYRHGPRTGGFYRSNVHYRGYYRGPRVGVVIGGPSYWGWWGDPWYYPSYYYSPYYYPSYHYPPVEAVPSVPQEYIERPREERSYESSSPSAVWYYCPESRAYYPYVKDCPKGWQKAPARPRSEPER